MCSGAWTAYVTHSFAQNGIATGELCKDVLGAMQTGRSEVTPVIVLAGAFGGEGKSMFSKPLFNVFSMDGMVFARPCKGN